MYNTILEHVKLHLKMLQFYTKQYDFMHIKAIDQ